MLVSWFLGDGVRKSQQASTSTASPESLIQNTVPREAADMQATKQQQNAKTFAETYEEQFPKATLKIIAVEIGSNSKQVNALYNKDDSVSA